jgi:hypothetical protein
MAKIINLAGKAQNGKDTTAVILKQKLEIKGKEVIIMHYADLVKYLCKQYFNWDGNKDEKGRTILQYVGTDVVREKKPNYWVDFIVGFIEMFQDKYDYAIIADCRFPNEIDTWKKDGWSSMSIKIDRIGFVNNLTEEQKNHPSETALDNYKFDYYMNINGGIEELDKEINKFIKYLGE